MSEAIKGQDELKRAVEKLEAKIFKDWPTETIGVIAHSRFIINSSLNFTIEKCRCCSPNDAGVTMKERGYYVTR